MANLSCSFLSVPLPAPVASLALKWSIYKTKGGGAQSLLQGPTLLLEGFFCSTKDNPSVPLISSNKLRQVAGFLNRLALRQ